MSQYIMHVLVCGGTGCMSSSSKEIIEKFKIHIKKAGMQEQVQIIGTGCFGFCEKGPIVKMIPDNTFYVQVKPEDVEEIVNEHLVKGIKVERLLYVNPLTHERVSDAKHMHFYQKQMRVALRNCGLIDPENIEEYIARDGYGALGKVLAMSQQEVIDEMKKSGLRGRGGGGFLTGLKWELAYQNKADQKLSLIHI